MRLVDGKGQNVREWKVRCEVCHPRTTKVDVGRKKESKASRRGEELTNRSESFAPPQHRERMRGKPTSRSL
ncbi:hypothetical protein BD309DRAFT_954512 [Dichomitus squalens]|nr:hypothetical protein BD309DRAFT_954512 [Dichomitus squalens]